MGARDAEAIFLEKNRESFIMGHLSGLLDPADFEKYDGASLPDLAVVRDCTDTDFVVDMIFGIGSKIGVAAEGAPADL